MDLTITFEFADPAASPDEDEINAALDELLDLLANYAPVGTGIAPAVPGGRWGVTITIPDVDEEYQDTSGAFLEAHRLVLEYAEKAGLPRYPFAHVELFSEAEMDRFLNEPDPRAPDLVGVAEIGVMLDVTRQRASQIQTRHDFPAPLARLKAGPVWRRHDIAVWADSWDRQPGRPRKHTYAVYIDDEIGTGPFPTADAAHEWVAEHHPGKPYAIVTQGPNQVGAGNVEDFLSRDQ